MNLATYFTGLLILQVFCSCIARPSSSCKCSCNISCKCECGSVDGSSAHGSLASTNGGDSSKGSNLDPHAWQHAPGGDIIKNSNDAEDRAGIRGKQYRWTFGMVPYMFDNAVPSHNRDTYGNALDYIESVSCVRFREIQPGEKLFIKDTQLTNWIKIEYPGDKGFQCQSKVGMRGDGEQKIIVTGDCFTQNTLIHETLHALGFRHEMSRSDRDKYIWIHPDEVRTNFNFALDPESEDFGSTYDYDSVMHYNPQQLSNGRGFDMKKRVNGRLVDAEFGRGTGDMSETDIYRLKQMYNCDQEVEHT